jgi:hypothetical protein
MNPISHATHIIIERNEGKNVQEENQFAKAPRDDEIKTMALHLQVAFDKQTGASNHRVNHALWWHQQTLESLEPGSTRELQAI